METVWCSVMAMSFFLGDGLVLGHEEITLGSGLLLDHYFIVMEDHLWQRYDVRSWGGQFSRVMT